MPGQVGVRVTVDQGCCYFLRLVAVCPYKYTSAKRTRIVTCLGLFDWLFLSLVSSKRRTRAVAQCYIRALQSCYPFLGGERAFVRTAAMLTGAFGDNKSRIISRGHQELLFFQKSSLLLVGPPAI